MLITSWIIVTLVQIDLTFPSVYDSLQAMVNNFPFDCIPVGQLFVECWCRKLLVPLPVD